MNKSRPRRVKEVMCKCPAGDAALKSILHQNVRLFVCSVAPVGNGAGRGESNTKLDESITIFRRTPMSRMSSMQCSMSGIRGTVERLRYSGSHDHPLNGARVAIVTNRFSGFLVELLSNHGPYRVREQVMIGENNFVRS